MAVKNAFGARSTFETGSGEAVLYRLDRIDREGIGAVDRLPYSIRVLLESVLRQHDGFQVEDQHVLGLASWEAVEEERREIPYKCARVVLQDFTGVPAVVDLAALRAAMQRLGGDPARINPQIPVDLVIDHSLQIDRYASPGAMAYNLELEFSRNRERYQFLRWGKEAFDDFRVVPPATGIIHQVNLEYLASVVATGEEDGQRVAFPDTLVGTDSHTVMINALGVVGWGVGGIEAEAAMLGQPIYMLTPDVVGFEMTGELPEGSTATDLVLTATQMLREHGVVGKFVEFFGEGVGRLSLADRAVVANMAPEYGATMGFFPVDAETLAYLRSTGRDPAHCEMVARYCQENHLLRSPDAPAPEYTSTLKLDLATVQPCLAGPKRPQDRIPLPEMKRSFQGSLASEFGKDPGEEAPRAPVSVTIDGETREGAVTHGSVVIASITSCTNTSNPTVMLGAGLLARKAVERGLEVPAHVKTSLAPGSRVVTRYLKKSGVLGPLESLGFHVVGYGCATCIGNSGPLAESISEAITDNDLVAAAVLSGNRNFEGRISPHTRANYLASPPLVLAYALAGSVDHDFETDPLGHDGEGNPVFLRDVWPSMDEIREAVTGALGPEVFREEYAAVFEGSEAWNALEVPEGELYAWDEASTYIREPPFFEGITVEPPPVEPIRGARALALLGDSVTTDHISPAGAIPPGSPAERYLFASGVERVDFNSFGSRRGNHEVMMRGTFGNIRLQNRLVPGSEGGVSVFLGAEPGRGGAEPTSLYDAAMRYKEAGIPLVVLAGKEYGTGSSRDWAAKGTVLLGVRAVIAESYERIHRSNLVGMGVLPLQFLPGESAGGLGLTGFEVFDLEGLEAELSPGQEVEVVARGEGGAETRFRAKVRIDTPVEVRYYRNGGILHTVLRDLVRASG